MSVAPPGHQERFRHVYAEHFDRVLGYALRRATRPEDAADVVSETFLVAWRRLGDVPQEPRTRLWLYAVARRILANQRRGDRRRTALGERLGAELAACVPDPAVGVTERLRYAEALSRLPERDREVMLLHVWEELEPREISEVLGISAVAARTRLSRARARLRAVVGDDELGDSDHHVHGCHDPQPAGHLLSRTSDLVPEEDR
jgi:RNA polymerase sigma-70 factor (ECF subfamily)